MVNGVRSLEARAAVVDVTEEAPGLPDAVDSEALFKDFASFVASFLSRLGVTTVAIDDHVQEVFLAAHRRGGYRPGPASPTTFLARLALEAAVAGRRRDARWRRAQREEVASVTVGGGPADPARALDEKRAARRLQEALAAIEPGRRAVFVLFELEGESCESIAAGLNLRLGTVYSRLHTARKEFRAGVLAGLTTAGPAPVIGTKEEAP
jgi:RNA polymerase sigma-70 factor, ECF subfamily